MSEEMNRRCGEAANLIRQLNLNGNQLVNQVQLASINNANPQPGGVTLASQRPALQNLKQTIEQLSAALNNVEEQINAETSIDLTRLNLTDRILVAVYRLSQGREAVRVSIADVAALTMLNDGNIRLQCERLDGQDVIMHSDTIELTSIGVITAQNAGNG